MSPPVGVPARADEHSRLELGDGPRTRPWLAAVGYVGPGIIFGSTSMLRVGLVHERRSHLHAEAQLRRVGRDPRCADGTDSHSVHRHLLTPQRRQHLQSIGHPS